MLAAADVINCFENLIYVEAVRVAHRMLWFALLFGRSALAVRRVSLTGAGPEDQAILPKRNDHARHQCR